jgi:hypothetical protein
VLGFDAEVLLHHRRVDGRGRDHGGIVYNTAMLSRSISLRAIVPEYKRVCRSGSRAWFFE